MTAKKLDAEKYRVLCEKEELICFMAGYAPYAPIRRITNGASKGAYILTLAMSDLLDAPYIHECYMEEHNREVFENECRKICQAWTRGKAELCYLWTRGKTELCYSWMKDKGAYVTGIKFEFSAETAARYALEFSCCVNGGEAVEYEKDEAAAGKTKAKTAAKPKRMPKRRAPRQKVFTGWTWNEKKWKWTKVCDW